jgi:hypothetical protein
MEWHQFEVEADENSSTDRVEPVPHTGLSASPELLHDRFLSDLGHLQDIHDNHQSWLGGNFTAVEQNFDASAGVLRTEAMLDRFGGRTEDGALILPLHGCELSGVKVEIGEIEGRTIIKLNLEGREGSELEQAFALPVGSGLESAVFSAGELHLLLR